MSDAIEAALLPCPFCGWTDMDNGGLCHALRSEDNPSEVIGPSGVCCPNCSAYAVGGMDDDEAIAAWNRRPALTAYEAAKGGGVDYFGSLVEKARAAAAKASIKFPQPNYVTLKIAEEAGEVVRGAVHYAENRMEWSEVEGEIVQLLAMLIRFVTEGDQINGVTPPPHTFTSPASGERDAPAGYVLVPVEPTAEMLRAGMDDLGWWVEPYEAPRESGVPIDSDMSAEDAAVINAQQIEVVASCYRAMLAAALRMEGK